MAKEKRSAADLDAELAALEAELAALEGKKAKKPKPEPAKPKKADAPEAPSAPEPAAPEPAAKKGRFSLPLPKKGKKVAQPQPGAPEPSVSAPEPAAPAHVAAPEPALAVPPAPVPRPDVTYDASVWRQDGDAWVRTVRDTPVPSVRRVLDENGNVVREEPVTEREVESTSAVKAERGLGRLLRRK